MLNGRKLFLEGINAQIARQREKERIKIGTLRAGNTGMIDNNGNVIASCPAVAYLRFLGIEIEPTKVEKELMFAGGRLNEDHWVSVLKESYPETEGKILMEEQIPISWETNNGIIVTGRPDIVLCSLEGIPKLGLELKQAMSVNSAHKKIVDWEPDLKHLLQAAHYMMILDCPYELWYTNRTNFDIPDWLNFRPLPTPGGEGSENLNYRFYRYGKINPKTNKPTKHKIDEQEFLRNQGDKNYKYEGSKILPFIKGFVLRFIGEELQFQHAETDGMGEWYRTIVTKSGIRRYFEYLSEITASGVVPKPAQNLAYDGKKINWKLSDYSVLKELDPEFCRGQDLNKWLTKIKTKFKG